MATTGWRSIHLIITNLNLNSICQISAFQKKKKKIDNQVYLEEDSKNNQKRNTMTPFPPF